MATPEDYLSLRPPGVPATALGILSVAFSVVVLLYLMA